MPDTKLALVIATNRPGAFREWFNAWKPLLGSIKMYVVEDQPVKSGMLAFLGTVEGCRHYAWDDIDQNLAENSWIIPRRTSAIKSYGFLQAYGEGADYIWTLDDDCLPEPYVSYVPTIKRIMDTDQADDSWYNTIEETGLYPRGYPYGIRQAKHPLGIHHGLWSGVPDLDGITALEYPDLRLDPFASRLTDLERVPSGKFFPMCGMNLVFRADMTPAMYFGLQGQMVKPQARLRELGELDKLPFDRFDDIWAGLFAKKIADHLGYAVTSGGPSIRHTKLSDPTQRVIKEGPGIAIHELLWKFVAESDLAGGDSVERCYKRLADDLALFQPAGFEKYFGKLSDAMRIWTEMF